MAAIWVDAQLPPQLAAWLRSEMSHDAKAVRELGLREADDRVIFDAARTADVIVINKDVDFVELVSRLGAQPKTHLAYLRQRIKRSAARTTDDASGCRA